MERIIGWHRKEEVNQDVLLPKIELSNTSSLFKRNQPFWSSKSLRP